MTLPDPTGGSGLRSVLDVIANGTNALHGEQILMIDNFSLQDSMSAVEIMDPRMDSGMINKGDGCIPFDPFTALLPEEVCWILDMAVACEMTWHQGYTLTQTVYTCRYVHHLNELHLQGPGLFTWRTELRRAVLRAGILGMLKSCDMAWRQLSVGNVHDTEDWNSEKADVSLIEGMQLPQVFELFDHAITWLEGAPQLKNDLWKECLVNRIEFRRAWLHVLSEPLTENAPYIARALKYSEIISSGKKPTIAQSSPHRRAFDHAVSRDLPSFLPLPVVEPFCFEETWKKVADLLAGKRLLVYALQGDCLLQWQSMANICSWIGSPKWPPYVRSLAMTVICTDDRVLATHTSTWMVDHFFWDTAQLPRGTLFKVGETFGAASRSKYPKLEQRIDELEQKLAKALIRFYLACFHSRSRQRREFANDVEEWQVIFDECKSIISVLKLAPGDYGVRERYPLAIQCQRLRMIQEVMMSGFELQLYAQHELAFAYWYTMGPVRVQREIIDELREGVKEKSSEMEYLRYQSKFLGALSRLLNAFARICFRQDIKSHLSENRIRLNFERRFKWAFGARYETLRSHDPAVPDYNGFELWQEGVQAEENWLIEVRNQLIEAHQALSHLEEIELLPHHLSLCAEEHDYLIYHLLGVCETYLSRTESWKAEQKVKLYWPADTISWFPSVQPQ